LTVFFTRETKTPSLAEWGDIPIGQRRPYGLLFFSQDRKGVDFMPTSATAIHVRCRRENLNEKLRRARGKHGVAEEEMSSTECVCSETTSLPLVLLNSTAVFDGGHSEEVEGTGGDLLRGKRIKKKTAVPERLRKTHSNEITRRRTSSKY